MKTYFNADKPKKIFGAGSLLFWQLRKNAYLMFPNCGIFKYAL